MIADPDIPRVVTKALLPEEHVEWVGKAAHIPKFAKGFFILFYGVMSVVIILTLFEALAELSNGGPFVIEGEPVTGLRAIGYIVLLIFLYGFYFLWRNSFRKHRYVVTNIRAFHYRPIWGGSWSWTREGVERDYTDPETSPISGGFFTANTIVSRSGAEGFGTIELGPLTSKMQDAANISRLKSAVPILNNIIYDPSNLDFYAVANPKMAEMEIRTILKKFKTKHNLDVLHDQ